MADDVRPPDTALELRVRRKETVADGVVALTLERPDGKRLPDWTPGAHLDLILPDGRCRQYSLCGDRWDAHRYRIGVLRERDGRGGSAYIHDELTEGASVAIGGPRNNFRLAPSDRYLFIAGGIGITPLLPMVHQAELLGADWRLVYGGRTRGSMAFLDELAPYGRKVEVVPQDEYGLLDVASLLPAAGKDTKVYCCGPAGLLDAVEAQCTAGLLRTERFTATDPGPVRDAPFEVRLDRSGLSLTVAPGQSVLDAVGGAGVNVLSSCRQGLCGTCETGVLAGEPDHRDSILDDDVHALARYDEVHAVLTDWQGFQSAAGVGLSNFRREKPWRPPSLLLEADPPRHDAPRAVLTKVLGPRSLRRLRDAWLDDAAALVDEVLAEPEFDAVTRLAEAFPLRVFPDAVGLGPDGREHLLPYGDHLFNAFGPVNDLVSKGQPRVAELSAWVNAQCERDRLSPGGFGAQIWAAADRGDLTHDHAPLVVRSLLSAGVDTTVHGLGAVLYAFAAHPDEWARLRRDPGLARVAFDEAVRWESPVQTFFRTAVGDQEVGGTVIPDGGKVLMFLAAANRDPRRWTDPDAFDLTRDPSGHVGFGMGIHQCVGQHVARLESEALLTALSRRVERFELAGTPRRHHNNTLRAWESLPLRAYLT